MSCLQRFLCGFDPSEHKFCAAPSTMTLAFSQYLLCWPRFSSSKDFHEVGALTEASGGNAAKPSPQKNIRKLSLAFGANDFLFVVTIYFSTCAPHPLPVLLLPRTLRFWPTGFFVVIPCTALPRSVVAATLLLGGTIHLRRRFESTRYHSGPVLCEHAVCVWLTYVLLRVPSVATRGIVTSARP